MQYYSCRIEIILLPYFRRNCVQILQWKIFIKTFPFAYVFLYINLNIICYIIIFLFVFDVSCLQDECSNELLFHDAKVISAVVVVVVFKENNLEVPWRFSWYSPKMADVLHPYISVYITRSSFIYHVLYTNYIGKFLGKGFLLINIYRRYGYLSILSL